MRFVVAIVVACLISGVVAVENQVEEQYISEEPLTTDFDIATQYEQQPLTFEKARAHLPMQQEQVGEYLPIQQEKVLVQPIVFQRAQKKHKYYKKHPLLLDIEKGMAYRVSPKVSAIDSRSVNVDFSPILNAKMDQEQIPQPQQQQIRSRTYMPVSFGYSAQPIYQKVKKTKVFQTSPLQQQQISSFHSSPILNEFGMYTTEQPIHTSFVGGERLLQDNIQTTNLGNSWLTSPYTNMYESTVSEPLVNANAASWLHESPLAVHSPYSTAGLVDDTIMNNVRGNIQSPFMSYPITRDTMNIQSDVVSMLGSSIDLATAPITTKTLLKVALVKPLKFKKMVKSCAYLNINELNADNQLVCDKVFSASKLVTRSPQLAFKIASTSPVTIQDESININF